MQKTIKTIESTQNAKFDELLKAINGSKVEALSDEKRDEAGDQ